MSGFPILDLVVGMIFIFFLLSIICSSAVEIILTGLNVRSKILGKWLITIFDKPVPVPNSEATVSLGQAIMDHCAITALSKKGEAPSYIDAKNFASALLEKITYDPNDPKSIAQDMDAMINAIKNTTALSTDFQRVLLTYANEAKTTYVQIAEKTASDIDLFRSKVEDWYDSSMQRVSGSLKKKWARPFTFLLAVVIAFTSNADTIAISKYLYSNPEARAKVAADAYSAVKDTAFVNKVAQLKMPPSAAGDTATAKTLKEVQDSIVLKLTELNRANGALQDAIPLGWKAGELRSIKTASSVLSKLIGLLVTVLAMIMGAPFWFDLLNRIANLRGSGAKPAASADDDKK